MLLPARLAWALGVLVLFLVVGVGGSTPLVEGSGATASGAVAKEANRGPQVPHGERRPLPSGGTMLRPATRCPATKDRPTASSLQAGMRAIDSVDWRSSDGGVSALLADGRVVWLFGDTPKVSSARRIPMVANSMLISSGSCFTQITRGHEAVIPDEGPKDHAVVTWPTSVVTVDRGGWTEVFVLGNRVKRTGGFWGFTLMGTNLTRFAIPDDGNPRLLDVKQLTADDTSSGHVTWGTGVAVSGNDLYVYGTQVVPGSMGRQIVVARTTWDGLAYPGQWVHRSAGGWSPNAAPTPVVGASPGVSHIISVFGWGSSWYIVSKIGGDLGNDVGVWKAASPGGPFTLARKVARPYHVDGSQVRYMPLAHPEFATGHDMVVSMSRNVTKGLAIQHDHALGRPEFFTVSLP